MWISFFCSVAFVAAILYLPGYLLSRTLLRDRFSALLCSPLISISAFVVAGIIFDFAGVSVSWYVVVLPVVIIGAAAVFATSKHRSILDQKEEAFRWVSLVGYIVVGVVLTGVYYVLPLDGADSFAQIFDNAAHLSIIQSFASSGHYSVFNASGYLDGSSIGVSPVGSEGLSFYPAAWHLVCALACDALSVSPAIAENAANVVFVGVLFPSAVCLLFNFLFKEERLIVLCGAVCCLAFESFPWGMMIFGPLYSNVAAFCLLPLALYCVGSLFKFEKGRMANDAIMFLVSGFALGVSQPNAIFAAVVLFSPYCATCIYSTVLRMFGSRTKALVGSLGLCLLLLTIWVVLWASPALNSVVSYLWPSFTGKLQSIINVLTLSLRDAPVQLALGGVVLLGLLSSLYFQRYRWLIWSYALSAIIYCVCASTDGMLKSMLSGFWYNDSYRIAGMLALAAIPLAAFGLSSLIEAVRNALLQSASASTSQVHLCAATFVIVPFLVFTFIPSHSLSGIANIETAFSRVTIGLTWLANPDNRSYTPEESSFVEKVKEIVLDDPGMVANLPSDGSTYAFGSDGLPVYYRTFFSYGTVSETDDSVAIRTSLDHVSADQSVRDAVSNANVKYVLLLDADKPIEDYSESDLDNWGGLLKITLEDEAFDLVLSEGDMVLYKIK